MDLLKVPVRQIRLPCTDIHKEATMWSINMTWKHLFPDAEFSFQMNEFCSVRVKSLLT